MTAKYPFLHDNEGRQTEAYCFNTEHVFINACHLIVLVCLRLFFTHEYSLLFSFRIFTAFFFFFFFSLVALYLDSPRLGLGILSRDGLSVCLCALTEVNLGWKTHPSERCLSSSSNVFIIFHVELIYQQDKSREGGGGELVNYYSAPKSSLETVIYQHSPANERTNDRLKELFIPSVNFRVRSSIDLFRHSHIQHTRIKTIIYINGRGTNERTNERAPIELKKCEVTHKLFE